MDLLTDLNPQQREAVCKTDGPLLILAGAGSGKTRVITHRIAYLISEKNVSPHRILAVTFTNKAAGEMRDRVDLLLGDRAEGLWVSTFHSACARLLRRHAPRIGLSRDFVLYDASDQTALVKECLAELSINEELYPPRTILARIGRLKHRLIGPEEFGRESSPFGLDEKVYRVYLRYQEKLVGAQGLDFDDLIGGAIRLFETAPDLLARYQEQFRYIMVDEYQDTNHAQYRLVNLLARAERNLCVVGDDDQSIYAFRGADIANILSFERDYPDSAVITLGRNYRSTQQILDAASTVIAKNLRRKEKGLFTEKQGGERPLWCRVANELEEARYLCRTIQRLRREEGVGYSSFCVLYRTNAQSRVIEEAFRFEEVPYLIVGGLRFYERKEVKDLIAYLRVIVNPPDNISLKRVVNTPARGIGGTTLDRLSSLASERGLSLYEALPHAIRADDFPSAARRGLNAFYQMVEGFRQQADRVGPGGLLKEIVREIRYEEALKKEYGPEAENRIENVWELLAAAEEMEGPEGLRLFLDQVALVSASEGNQDGLEGREGSVSLMTLHSAKGLEFPVVFIVGMEEGLFPHAGAQTDPEEMEEERRLCYVGITRAKERLYFTSALQRRLYGTPRWGATSRFVEELLPAGRIESAEFSTDGIELDVDRFETRRDSEPRIDDPASSEDGEYPNGSYVRHPVFGIGQVQRSEGSGERRFLTVRFDVGTKKLALKYAKLERL
jgi:DNA helicase-2/ATP-dependent DNA helicase PcrA